MKKTRTCDSCFKVICAQCGWEATEEEMELIQKKELTTCPICGWYPS